MRKQVIPTLLAACALALACLPAPASAGSDTLSLFAGGGSIVTAPRPATDIYLTNPQGSRSPKTARR